MSDVERTSQAAHLGEDFLGTVGIAPPSGLIWAMAGHPAGERWCQFANGLLCEGLLSERERELVILRAAERRRSLYIRTGHRAIAGRGALSLDEMQRLADADLSAWDGRERLLLEATDALDRGDSEHPAYAALREELDEAHLVELGMLVGQYILVSLVVKLLDLQPEPVV